MNITGKIRVFKNEIGYSTTISNKNMEGQYENMYIALQLKKDVEIENNAEIEIIKGFLSFYKNKNGFNIVKAIVMEYIPIIKNDFEITEEDDLPF